MWDGNFCLHRDLCVEVGHVEMWVSFNELLRRKPFYLYLKQTDHKIKPVKFTPKQIDLKTKFGFKL